MTKSRCFCEVRFLKGQVQKTDTDVSNTGDRDAFSDRLPNDVMSLIMFLPTCFEINVG